MGQNDRRPLFLASAVCLLLVVAAAGCKDNPLYCDTSDDCTDPLRPYCDLTGAHDPDGLGHSCVPDPGIVDAGPGDDGDVDPLCGNGGIDGDEACDGDNLNGHTCEEQGFAGGTLACRACELDTDGCEAPPGCPDGTIGPTEDCDGADLGGGTCESEGYAGGTLACTGACRYDTSDCTYCGNLTIQPGEACDGTNLNDTTCGSLPGFQEGTLACNDACSFDTSGCISCGDQLAEGSESCDGQDLGGNDCTTIEQGYVSGTLGCNDNCTFDTSACVAPPNCPNGTLNSGEDCDPPAMGSGTCATETAGVRPSGQLSCGDGCQYDSSGCYACGDNLVQGPEVCDGSNFAGVTCQSLGHDGGNLTCGNDCLSRSETTCSDCGDNVIEGTELCDGTALGGADCTTVGDFSGGTLTCASSCSAYNTSGCFGPPTVPVLKRPLANAYVGSMHASGTRKPVFEWKAATVQGGGAIRYDIQYSTDPTFGTAVTTVDASTFTSYQPSADIAGATAVPVGARYYWHVRACKANACSAYSPSRLLNIGRSDNDFNGDGYADIAIDAPYQSPAEVEVYLGPTMAVNAVINFTGGQAVEEFGTHLAVGDWNGDGFSDLATGAITNDISFTDAGQLRVWFGGATINTTVDRTLNGPNANARLGSDVANLGDVNGDGFDDLAVGISGATNSDGTTGRTEIFFGGAGTAFDMVPEAVLTSPVSQTSLFGSGATGVDLNCDGYYDVVERGATGTVFHGGPGTTLNTTADATLGPSGSAGRSVADAGDVNNDGCGDLIRGYNTSASVNSARVTLGSATGSFGSVQLTPPTSTDTTTDFGEDVSGAGDVNNDGFPDVIIGARGDNGGRAHIFFGGATMNVASDATFVGPGEGNNGDSVGGGSDANGDGIADVAIAAVVADTTTTPDGGKVFVLYGGNGSFNTTADKTFEGTTTAVFYGTGMSF